MKITLLKHKLILICVFLITFSCIMFNFKINKAKTKSSLNKEVNLKKENITTDKIIIRYENKDLNLKLPIYTKTNRYFIPVNEFVDNAGGKFLMDKNKAIIALNNKQINFDLHTNKYISDDKEYELKEKPIFKSGVIYLSIFDFGNIFDLKTLWNTKIKSIEFYNNKDNHKVNKDIEQNTKIALLRLEDITAGGIYISDEALEKLRIVAEYLYSESIPFHVAWVPRYVNLNENVNNDLVNNYNMQNANFLYTLDYFNYKGGIIGLHGYTHQYGKEISVDGIEFHVNSNDNIPDNENYAEDRIKLALNCASKLNIKCEFYEVPHYAILPQQMRVIERFFNYVYQPYSEDGGITMDQNTVEITSNDKKTIYIPTPLDYIDGKKDCENMIDKISRLDEETLGSFFYHPYIEFEDINLYRDKNGYPTYIYSEESTLHRVINCMKENNFKFYNVSDIK